MGSPSTFSKVFFNAPSSLSLPEIFNWFAAQLILSLLERIPSGGISLPKYPFPILSIPLTAGGDFELGLAIELPLPLLELFLLFPCLNLAR